MLHQATQAGNAVATTNTSEVATKEGYAEFADLPAKLSYIKFNRKPRQPRKKSPTAVASLQSQRPLGLPIKRDDWETPDHIFDALNYEFSFDLDPCCYPHTAKCKDYFTREDDGLAQSWAGRRVWMNPPYGEENMPHWLEKARRSAHEEGALVVCLIPAHTGTQWFLNALEVVDECRFVKGRITFKDAPSSADFPSAIFIYRPRDVVEKSPEPLVDDPANWSWLERNLWELFPDGPRKRRGRKKAQYLAVRELSCPPCRHDSEVAQAFLLEFGTGVTSTQRNFDLECIAQDISAGQALEQIMKTSSAERCSDTHWWLAQHLQVH